MNVKMLKTLLAVPTSTFNEQPMVDYLVHYIRHQIPGTTVTVDEARNIYVTKGSIRYSPCVAAHIDSVHPHRKVHIVQEGTRLVGYDSGGQRCGIGADDKTGIFVCLNLLKQFDNIRAVLFASEEQGMVGARHADPKFFEGVGYIVEYDCPSRHMFSYSCGGVRLFANDGEFIKVAGPCLARRGTTLWQNHPYTDVKTVRQRFPISCLNLSSGYYNSHQRDEFASLPDITLAIETGIDLIGELDHVRYDCPVTIQEDAKPLIRVCSLLVPPAHP